MLDRLVKSSGNAFAWLFVIAMLISAYEVVMRYAFNAPSTWAHELSTALCAVGFCLGGAFCMARREHIRITIVSDKVAGRGRLWIERLSTLVGTIYLVGLGWGAWLQARESILRFEGARWQPELTPGPPGWPLPALVKGALLVGALLFLVVVLRDLAVHLRGRRT